MLGIAYFGCTVETTPSLVAASPQCSALLTSAARSRRLRRSLQPHRNARHCLLRLHGRDDSVARCSLTANARHCLLRLHGWDDSVARCSLTAMLGIAYFGCTVGTTSSLV